MEKNKIIDTLESIGFSKNEALVYIDLISMGKSSAGDISKRTQLHRSNIYDILDKLQKKGIVYKTIENETNIFYPVEPTDLLKYMKQKQEELKKIIPNIKNIQNKPKEERHVSISEGINSVKNILINLLDMEEPIDVYGTPKEAIEVLGGFIKEFDEKRLSRKIPMRHIVGAASVKRLKTMNKMEFTEARYLPSSYSSNTSTNICGDKVVIIMWDMPVSAIVIKNRNVADTYRNYFNILWKEAEVKYD